MHIMCLLGWKNLASTHLTVCKKTCLVPLQSMLQNLCSQIPKNRIIVRLPPGSADAYGLEQSHTHTNIHREGSTHTHTHTTVKILYSWMWSHSRAICKNAWIFSYSFYSESSGVCDCACVNVKRVWGICLSEGSEESKE